MRAWIVAGALVALAAPAAAAPIATPEPEAPEKRDAQAMVTEGVALLRARKHGAALAKFRAAYARYPSPKILLNIGSTLREMGRLAEAANVYQEYIGDPATAPERLAEVKKILRELDAKLVLLTVAISPAGAEVSIDGRPWQPIGQELVTRVTPGARLVRARSAGFEPAERSVTGGPGESRRVALTLTPVALTPAPAPGPAPGPTPAAWPAPSSEASASPALTAARPAAPSRHRVGIAAAARIDGELRGAATSIGLVYGPLPHLELEAAALLADVYGAYAGARVRPFLGAVRPVLSAGAPMFWSDGTRVAARIALGGEVALNDHLLLVAEAGYEHFFNPEDGYRADLFVPLVGLHARL
jgi:tetratricopeptide (TPR) repeat protein